MSKVAPKPVKVKKTYRFFNDNLEFQTKEVSVDFVPAADYEEAVSRLGTDTKKLLAALNARLKREALNEARSAVNASGISSKVVMAQIRSLREIEPFKSMDRKEQTAALLEKVRGVPFLMEAIKAMSAAADVDDDDDEDSTADETQS